MRRFHEFTNNICHSIGLQAQYLDSGLSKQAIKPHHMYPKAQPICFKDERSTTNSRSSCSRGQKYDKQRQRFVRIAKC